MPDFFLTFTKKNSNLDLNSYFFHKSTWLVKFWILSSMRALPENGHSKNVYKVVIFASFQNSLHIL